MSDIQSKYSPDNHELEQLNRRSHSAVLYTMMDMLELRDGYTGTHVQQVADYISLLVSEMAKDSRWGFTAKDAYIISQSALLHDLGKIAVPDHILLNKGKLTTEEYEIIKTHTVLGAESQKKTMIIMGESSFFQLAYNITRYHHERWDGSGYPDGLTGCDIPLEARIAAVADVYDAVRSKRPYKEAIGRQKACDIILEGRGTSFDPEIVDVFLRLESEFDSYANSTL